MKTPDYEEKISLDLPPGTTLEDLGDMVVQSDPEKLDEPECSVR